MPLSWNEIRQRAITFARAWSDASRERAEAQTFWNEFFEIFGIRRRTVASFEEPVKNLAGQYDFIDLFWKGTLIAEHKSRGKDLSKAASQAFGYVQSLASDNRNDDIPRYILVSDFQRFALHDLEAPPGQPPSIEFALKQLHKHIRAFAFINGQQTRPVDPEDPANFKAVGLLANLHDRLEDDGYTGHDLQRFMVRILFCLFADDTNIFEPDTFKNFIEYRTRADGSDLGSQLSRFFEVLNTPEDRRQKNLDEDLAVLPYVNGDLFAERLGFADFNSAMREALLACCLFHWEKISPAVFGSLFQGIMDAAARRQIGAHYTSERDILKVIRSLFLDDLRDRFESARNSPKKLAELQADLGKLRLLDPACGCGNFLVLAYRELRRLEMDILQARFGDEPDEGDIRANCHLAVSQFFGIEIEEWPVRIAEVALWLMDHQMNAELFARFGTHKATVPLKSSPTIRQANALRIDWNDLLPAKDCSYILGNPPFVAKHLLTKEQNADMESVWGDDSGAGVLDFVTAWYRVAAEYIQNTDIRVAFVSTNSITQGEQVYPMWTPLFRDFNIKIHFAHRTFRWTSEARGKAHVHVVIIGFGCTDCPSKLIWDYPNADGERGTSSFVKNVSPYLIDAANIIIKPRTTPVCSVPNISKGSQPTDDGNLIVEYAVHDGFLNANPTVSQYVRPLLCAEQYLHGEGRWCLWLVDADPAHLKASKETMERLQRVKEFRLASKKAPTRKKATTPGLFTEIRQPQTEFLVVPRHTSENRQHIPIGYFQANYIVHDSCSAIPDASLYHFGVLSSAMHMAWVRQVCGRLESRYRYSNKLVYNNYPWPQEATDKQKRRVERAAQGVLDAREKFAGQTLADLYDPLTMPADLVKAHQQLDAAVDKCYRAAAFNDDRQRVEYLFGLYEKLIAPLTAGATKPRRPRKRKNH